MENVTQRHAQRLHQYQAARLAIRRSSSPAEGVVAIDTPQLPSRAVGVARGGRVTRPDPIPDQHRAPRRPHLRQLLLQGRGHVVNHQGLYDRFMVPGPEIDPFDYAHEALPADDPAGEAIFPARDDYYRDPNKGSIVFTGDITISRRRPHVQPAAHARPHARPDDGARAGGARRVHRRHALFSGCQTWLMTSDVDEWVAALDRIRTLDVDWLVPGHGPVVTKALPGRPASAAARLEDRRRRRGRQGLVARRDRGARQLRRRVRPGRHRPGVHARVHPDVERGRAVGQADRLSPRWRHAPPARPARPGCRGQVLRRERPLLGRSAFLPFGRAGIPTDRANWPERSKQPVITPDRMPTRPTGR